MNFEPRRELTFPQRRIRVLIVDDSAVMRKLLAAALAGDPDLEVVGTAPDPYVARDRILELEPDVLTLDIEMPRMDGLTFLRRLMHFRPMPVIVISSRGRASCSAALEAMAAGAVEVLAKPAAPEELADFKTDLPARVRSAAVARLRSRTTAAPAAPLPGRMPARSDRSVVAIGASTGGVEAISSVLARLPEGTPPIVIAQHIPAGFSHAFAQRLNGFCRIRVREARDGDPLEPGLALVAPGNRHMRVVRRGAAYAVTVQDGPRVCFQRPSVDVLFASVAETAGPNGLGVLLTGMGNDGAHGLLLMRKAGARTIAQDESTSVVFGMPREAIRAGAAGAVVPLGDIAPAILAAVP